jgi:hypothetical protein
LPRPSSALKPSHPPDGVGVVGSFGGVCLAFGVILLLVRRCLAYVWCHFELLGSFTLHSCIIAGAELHLFLDSIFYIAGLF